MQASTTVDSVHLADLMSHLCETMDTFRQAMSSGVVASPPVMSLPPQQNPTVQRSHPGPSSRQVDQTKNSDVGPPKKEAHVMKPQMFDGKEPINSFFAHLEVCAEFNHWTQ